MSAREPGLTSDIRTAPAAVGNLECCTFGAPGRYGTTLACMFGGS
jgi:hypothetical protein